MITYPVNPTARFTFKLHGEVRRGKFWPKADGMPLEGRDVDSIILEEFAAPIPVFDPATERMDSGAWVDDEVNETATFTYAVVPLTQDEIDVNAQAKADAAERTVMKGVVADLKAGTGTQGERLQRCERALARIIPDIYRQ